MPAVRHPPTFLNKAGGENKMKKLMGEDEEITYILLSEAKHTQLGENYLNLLTIKIELDSKKQRQNLKHLSPPLYPRLHFTPSFPTLLPPPRAVLGHWGEDQHTAVPLCSSFLLRVFSCSSMGPLHRSLLLQDKTAPAWTLLHRARFLQGVPTCCIHKL